MDSFVDGPVCERLYQRILCDISNGSHTGRKSNTDAWAYPYALHIDTLCVCVCARGRLRACKMFISSFPHMADVKRAS
jgi:hypothetical protein